MKIPLQQSGDEKQSLIGDHCVSLPPELTPSFQNSNSTNDLYPEMDASFSSNETPSGYSKPFVASSWSPCFATKPKVNIYYQIFEL